MKILRPGNTEIILLFIYFVKEHYYTILTMEQKKYIKSQHLYYMTWLYKTAGYYDKDVEINRIERNMYTEHDNTIKLKKYIKSLLDSIKNCYILYTPFESFFKNMCLSSYYEKFIDYIHPLHIRTDVHCTLLSIKKVLMHKKILVISPFKELMEEQINNGNFHNMYEGMHNDLIFEFYKYPYKFFNNGPHHDIHETLQVIYKDLESMDYDVCLISCGSDSLLLADYNNHRGIHSIYLGGFLPVWFGIIGNRYADNYDIYFDFLCDRKYLVMEIPDKYKPSNYMNVENGCYW